MLSTTSFLFLSTLSQAQPLPKRPAAAAVKACLEGVEAAQLRLIASASLPRRLAALARADRGPEHRVVGVAAAVVADRGANVLGHLLDVAQQLFDRLVVPRGALDRLVQIRDVGRVMLVVMDFHRPGVDVRLQRVEGVGQRGKLVWHGSFPPDRQIREIVADGRAAKSRQKRQRRAQHTRFRSRLTIGGALRANWLSRGGRQRAV